MQKIGLYNKKTKIYQTIKGLIILFIKLQFSNQVQQAFRPLRTSTSNIYLNVSLNPNDLITYIIPNTFVSSPIHLIIPNVHQQKFLFIHTSQVQAYVLVRPEGHWSTYQEAFVILVHALTFIEDKADVRTREKS